MNWQRLGGKMPSNAHPTSDGKLIFTNVKKSDSGLYQCAVENSLGKAEGSAMIFVQGLNLFFSKYHSDTSDEY